MRLSICKSAAFAAVLALAACTVTEVIEVPVYQNSLTLGQGEDVIRISISNTTETRAARPMGSSEAANNVNRIAFMFVTSSQQMATGITLEGVINEVSGDKLEGYDPDGNVLKLPKSYNGGEICVKFSGLQQGAYKIIACGYNYTEGIDSVDAFPYTMKLLGEDYLVQCEDVKDVQEIFAGYNEGELMSVNEHGKFGTPPVINLKRQVAGLMAYFENVPVFVANTKVAKVTVSSKADVTGFCFPADFMDNPDYNGLRTNGWNESKWVDYLTFDMKKASNYTKSNLSSDATYLFETQEDGFLLADETDPIEDLVCNENTLFGSRFLLAYPGYYDCSVQSPECATLNICYWDENGDLILSVPLRNGGADKPLDSSSNYQYHILCNNFYSIGEKGALGGEPDDNSPLDIDEPTGYDYAEVSISNDWKDSHSLVN